MTRTVYVVPHCHWDREWYQPHELFRWRLVQMIDELLDHMEAHPEFRCFNLDGQSIVIDDYLELRPENEGRLRRLIEQGRIVIGPWWVQPDEFLVTENQFHVAERPLTPPPWNGESAEPPPLTFPQKTFAAVEGESMGLAVFNRGLPEGEVVRNNRGRQAYALTLLRCVGWLSRNDLTTRRGGAGPMVATPGAQMPGWHTFDYALTTYRDSWRDANVLAMAHSFAYPPLAFATNAHAGSERGSLPLLSLGSPFAVPSAMHRSDENGMPIVRVYNASGRATTADLRIPAASGQAIPVDLMDRPTGGASGWDLSLRPWEIASVTFDRGD